MKFEFSEFKIDRSLMFIIQTYIGDSTEEILVTLYEAAVAITTQSISSTKAKHFINRKAKFFYKKTNIPVCFQLRSGHLEHYRKLSPVKPLPVSAFITFSQDMIRLDSKRLDQLSTEKFENNIGISDETTTLAKLDKPKTKIPRGMKGFL